MSNAVFPANVKGLAFTTVKAPEFKTIVQAAGSGSEVRIQQRRNPIWHFALMYEFLFDNFLGASNTKPYSPYTDIQTMMGFVLARSGQNDDFLYTDPDDNSLTLAQLQLVNDGSGNYYSPVQRNMGGLFYEDITDLNGGITVYANGVLQTGGGVNYSLLGPGLSIPGNSYLGMYLHWIGGAPATPITATFNYYFRVRFETDQVDFEKFMDQLWTIGGENSRNGSGQLKMVTSRPPGV